MEGDGDVPTPMRTITRRCIAILLALVLGATRLQAVTASWTANPESDIAGYVLSYGTASGVYTTVFSVGNVLSFSFTITQPGTYFFVLQAVNTSGLTSPRSAEVTQTFKVPNAPVVVIITP